MTRLHQFARNLDLLDLSELQHFRGEECVVRKRDQFNDLKIRARGVHISETKMFTYLPTEIWGFTVTLLNGSFFHLGLATYPKIIVLPDRTAVNTKTAGWAQWIGFNETFNEKHPDTEDCVRSYIWVISLLKQAKRQGMNVFVQDPVGCWNDPCTDWNIEYGYRCSLGADLH